MENKNTAGRRSRRVRTAAVLTAVMATAVCLAGGLYLRKVAQYQRIVKEIRYVGIDVGDVADGIYEGECDAGLVAARVSVSVQDGRLTRIDLLEHKNGRGKAAEQILPEMIGRQSLEVDAVSGATNSSRVIRKAVENALMKGCV